MASQLIFRAECRTKDSHGFTLIRQSVIIFSAFHATAWRCFLDSDRLCLWTHLISTIIPISEFHNDHILQQIMCIGSNYYMWVKVKLTEDLFNPMDSKSSAKTNLHAIPQNLFSTEGARDGPIWTVILQMLFQIFPLEFLTTILWAKYVNKITLFQVILRKEEQFLGHGTFLNMNLHKLFHNIASKVTQFQPSNLLTSSACSPILWMHADDTMTPALLSTREARVAFEYHLMALSYFSCA